MVIRRLKKHGARFSIYLLAFMLLKSSWWIHWKFGSPTIDQIVFHFQNGNEALADADPKVFQSFLNHVVLLPILFALLTFALQQFVLSNAVGRFIQRHRTRQRKLPMFYAIAKVTAMARYAFDHHLPIGLLLIAGILLANQVALWTHLRNLEVSEFIDDNYVAPVDITPPSTSRIWS